MNLPLSERTPFVGRVHELEAVRAAFGHGARLVSVVGAAGVGKTRLARRLARESAAAYAGGVWFCDLTAARDVDDLLASLADVLDVPLAGGDPEETIEQLGRAVAALGPTLLVLDNLEQLRGVAEPTLGAWISAAPEADFLATSIVRLGLEGETCFELPPMTPDDAVALYEERARRFRGDLAVPDADTVRELVAGLDHLPLAIELAAARASVLTPRQLLARIGKRLELLRGPRYGRHTSLEGAIACAWDLLSACERDALAQCAVFRGGFTVEAAEAVLDLSHHDEPPAILDVLESLREKSFLRRHGEDGERFALYQSVRDFAERALTASGGFAAAVSRHRHAFLAIGERLAGAVDGPDGIQAVHRLASERENLLAAHMGSMEEAPALAVRLGLALMPLPARHGPPAFEAELADRVVQAAKASGDETLEAEALSARAEIRIKLGRAAEARSDLDEGLPLARRLGLEALEARLLVSSGRLRSFQGDVDAALQELSEAVATLRRLDARHLEARALNMRGSAEEYAGRLAESAATFEEALALFREVGDLRSQGLLLMNLSVVRSSMGRPQEAMQLGEQALALLEEVGDRNMAAGALVDLGDVALVMGDLDVAEAYLERALALSRALGNKRFEGLSVGNLGILDQERGRLRRARRRLLESISLFRACEERRFLAVARTFYAGVEAALGEVASATADFEAARDGFDELGDPGNLAALEVMRGFLDLARAREAAERLALTEVDEAVEAARRRLGQVPPHGVRSSDLTIARRILGAAISERTEPTRPGGANASPPAPMISSPGAEGAAHGDALQVCEAVDWFLPPAGERVDISRRGPLRLVLQGLVEQRILAPGVGLSSERVFEIGWPEQKADPASAANRVYAAIRTLRSLGLEGLLQRRDDGYFLEPSVPVVRVRG